MKNFRSIKNSLTIGFGVAICCTSAFANTVSGTCSTAGGPTGGQTNLGPPGRTGVSTDGTVNCSGFNSNGGNYVLTSISINLTGAISTGSNITISNTSTAVQSGSASTIIEFFVDPSNSFNGFTLPQNGIFSTELFDINRGTGDQTLNPGQVVVFPISGSKSTGALTNTDTSTFGNYTPGFSFIYDTITNLNSSFGGGNAVVTQTTLAQGTATVAYTYTDNTPTGGTPEPTTMLLFGSGLLGLGLLRKRVKA